MPCAGTIAFIYWVAPMGIYKIRVDFFSAYIAIIVGFFVFL
jgi:hypothetical protein